jgi:hypothetical protein
LDKQKTAAPPTSVLDTEKALMRVLDVFTCSLVVNIGNVDLDTKAEASKTQIATTVKRRLRIIIAVAVLLIVLFLLV